MGKRDGQHFLGLRSDREAKEVVSEGKEAVRSRGEMTEPEKIIEIARREVKITRPHKVLFPDEGITKVDLVEYYRRIAAWILPHLKGRPLMLERYPDGIDGTRIVQKAASSYYPRWIKTATVKKAGGTLRQVVCEDAAALGYLVNQACITPHIWLSRLRRPNNPDQMIFDLDPSGSDFGPVRETAHSLREKLEEIGLPTYVKSTGSRGVHITVPLKPEVDFDRVRSFARQLAEIVAQEDPKHRTIEQRKGERRGRLFLDTNRNAYAQTVVAPYAVRARAGAPVAIPISWRELDNPEFRPAGVTIRTIFDRLKKQDDPWKDLWRNAVSLPRKESRRGHGHAA
jgi:bifunctional non-homologous end joining protein LigD